MDPRQSGADPNDGDGHRDPYRVAEIITVEASDRLEELHPDQNEQPTVEKEGRLLPERQSLQPRAGPDHMRREPGSC
ncbi:hypothetical protein BH24ACT6_BH24ACT6_13060 [soil metagenome]